MIMTIQEWMDAVGNIVGKKFETDLGNVFQVQIMGEGFVQASCIFANTSHVTEGQSRIFDLSTVITPTD